MADEKENESIGAVFVEVGADLSKLRSDMTAAKAEASSMAKDISKAATVKFGGALPITWGPTNLAEIRARVNRPSTFDAMVGNDARRSRAAPSPAELALYRQGEKERGMALERAMAAEQRQIQRAAAREARQSASEAQKAWRSAQKAAADHAEEVQRRWKALGDYIKGDAFKLHGKSLWEDFSNGASKAFSIVGGAAKLFFAPITIALSAIKAMIPLLLAAGAAAVTFGTLAFRAATKFEDLKTRIRYMIGGSTAGLERQANYIQSRTPFSNEDALMALGKMQSRGLVGRQVAGGLANFAAITGGTMTGAAQQLSSGRAYMLRQYGIEQSKGKEGFVVRFQMPSGQQVRLVGQTFAENTRNLLQAVNMKFAGAAVAAAKTMSGIFSQIRNLFGDALRQFGEGLLPAGKGIGTLVVNALNRWLETGQLRKWGKEVGAWLLGVAAHLGAFIGTMPTIIEELSKLFRNPTTLSDAIFAALSAGAKLIGSLLVTAIEGTFDFWKSIGDLIGESFKRYFVNTIAEMGIWGSGAAESIRGGMVGKGAKSLLEEYNQTPGLYGPHPSRAKISSELAWKEFQAKYPALAGLDSPDDLSVLQEGPWFSNGPKRNEFFKGPLGKFLQERGSGIGFAEATSGLGSIPGKMGSAAVLAAKEFRNQIIEILKGAGVDTGKIGETYDAWLKKFTDFFAPFLSGTAPEAAPPTTPEEKKEESPPIEARSASFSEWVSVAQEAALKKKDSEHLGEIADYTRETRDRMKTLWAT